MAIFAHMWMIPTDLGAFLTLLILYLQQLAEELHAFISLQCCSQAVMMTSPHPHSRHRLLKTSAVLPSAVSSAI